jgi:hypothetical protein
MENKLLAGVLELQASRGKSSVYSFNQLFLEEFVFVEAKECFFGKDKGL